MSLCVSNPPSGEPARPVGSRSNTLTLANFREFQIDAAELHRVFPFHAIGENGKMNHHATGAQTETAILEARIAVLKDMAELLRE
jgi:hypothetical protein